MESANGTVKVECVYAEHYTTCEQARLSITEYLAYYKCVSYCPTSLCC